MTYTVKTVSEKRTYGWHSTRYCENMADVERALSFFERSKTPAVATDHKGQIIGRVIEETKGNFRMWIEPIS